MCGNDQSLAVNHLHHWVIHSVVHLETVSVLWLVIFKIGSRAMCIILADKTVYVKCQLIWFSTCKT